VVSAWLGTHQPSESDGGVMYVSARILDRLLNMGESVAVINNRERRKNRNSLGSGNRT